MPVRLPALLEEPRGELMTGKINSGRPFPRRRRVRGTYSEGATKDTAIPAIQNTDGPVAVAKKLPLETALRKNCTIALKVLFPRIIKYELKSNAENSCASIGTHR